MSESKKVIFAKDLIAEVIKVANRTPDYVYNWREHQGCKYAEVDLDEGSCMYGKALVNLGVSIEELRALDNQIDLETTIQDIALEEYDRHSIIISASEEEAEAMQEVQNAQDNEMPWGKAIAPLMDFIKSVDWTKE